MEVYTPDIYYSVAKTNVECYGAQTGTISITTTTPSAQFSINSGNTYQTGNSFISLFASTNNIYVKDDNNCIKTYSSNPVVIAEPNPFLADVEKTDVQCYGENNGTLKITASGGNGNYKISIDGGITFPSAYSNGEIISNLIPDNYNIRIKDAKNCELRKGEYLIAQPFDLDIAIDKYFDLKCYNQNTGQILLSSTGGKGTKYYSIDDGISYKTSGTFSSLPAGSYNIKVKDDNNCIKTNSGNPLKLTQPEILIITNQVVSQINCFGNKGSILIQASGGTSTLTYSIDDGLSFPYNNGSTASNLSKGLYSIIVKDNNNCTIGVSPINITEPSEIKINQVDIINSNCYKVYNGSFTISAQGGTGTLQYSIDGINFKTESIFTNVQPAEYTIKVKDNSNCSTTVAKKILPLPNPQLCMVSYDQTEGRNLLVWEPNQVSNIKLYKLFREDSITGNYVRLATVNAFQAGLYVDNVALPNQFKYKYKISAVDLCDTESDLALTRYHQTMLLTITKDQNSGKSVVNCSPYIGYSYNNFKIYRKVRTGNFQLIAQLPADTSQMLQYIDYGEPNDSCIYYVAANRLSACNVGLKIKEGPYDSSISNLEDNRLKSTSAKNVWAEKILAYPNPTTGMCNIYLTTESDVTITIFNQQGILISSVISKAKREIEIDLSGNPAGIYFVKISNEVMNEVIKIEKQ